MPLFSRTNAIQGVFSELIENLQVKDVQVKELYSYEKPFLVNCMPLYGVIFLFKYSDVDRTNKPLDGIFLSQLPEDQQTEIFFAQQVIQNACGTQAVLNVLLNRDDVDLGPELSSFKEFTSNFDPMLKGETMTNSSLIRTVHNSFTSPNMLIDETRPPPQSSDNDGLYHFIGFIQKDGRIWELDGLKPEPIAHELCTEEEFAEKLSFVIQRRMRHYKEGELRFSLLGVMKDRRVICEEIGDVEGLQMELTERERWGRENTLRRMDMTGLVHDMVKLLAKTTTAKEWIMITNSAASKGLQRQISQSANAFQN
jgi:ubiquitin carboxyl-terminal hydrolase L5